MKSSTCPESRKLVRSLRSIPAEVETFCREVREYLKGIGLSCEAFPVEMLLRESLNNAMVHGNRENSKKKILAEVRIGRKWIMLRVTDEGRGFDYRKTKKTVPDPEAVSGRGMAIYSLYAHRISFNSTGNRVSLWRAVTGEGKP